MRALAMTKGGFESEKALDADGISFICEVKKASPSKGVIAEDFPYLEIAREYEAAGAAAISCLTEPKWFMGSDEYLREIAGAVSIPVLRKDFTICDYQIYEAKTLGASAVLLITLRRRRFMCRLTFPNRAMLTMGKESPITRRFVPGS